VGLNFPEQLRLYELVSGSLGVKMRHPLLAENLAAAYDKNTIQYKENVLEPFWTYNGIISMKNDDGSIDVRRATGAKFVDEIISKSTQIIQDSEGRESPIKSDGTQLRIRYVCEPPLDQPPLQTELPTISGYFNDFKGIAPTDADLKRGRAAGSKAYWWGASFDDEGLSAVRSLWVSGGRGLVAFSYWPLVGGSCGALGVWTDEDPKK